MTDNNEKKMKNSFRLILVLNVILIIGLAILFYLFFQNKNTPSVEVKPTAYELGSDESLIRIAYIDSDTILTKYKLAIKKSKELEAKGRRMEADVLARQEQYEKDAIYFQEQVQSNALSEKSAQFIYNQLMEEQQKIMELQEQYAAELGQAEFNVNVILLDSVTNFLDRINMTYKFDYILGYNKAGNIFLTNKKYDITEIVVEGLNTEYDDQFGEE